MSARARIALFATKLTVIALASVFVIAFGWRTCQNKILFIQPFASDGAGIVGRVLSGNTTATERILLSG